MTLLIWKNDKTPPKNHQTKPFVCDALQGTPVPRKYATQLKVMKRPQPSSTSRSPSNLMENEFRLDARGRASANICVCCWKDLRCLTESVIPAAFYETQY